MNKQTAKKRTKERDGHECRFCGVTQEQHTQEYGRGLEAHHIIKDGDGGSDHPKNLITVCRDCHTTLEKTQAKALSRIKNEHTNEGRVEELTSDLEEMRERVEVLESEKVDTPIEVFAWLEETSVRIHLVHRGKFSPDIEMYQDKEEAAEAYSKHDNAVRIESRTVRFSDLFEESLRVASVEEIKPYVNPYADEQFKSGQQAEGYLTSEIPEELQE